MDRVNDAPPENNVSRLLILTDSPITVSGGSERFLRNLLGQLPAEHYHITLVHLCEAPPADTVMHGDLPPSVRDVRFMPFRALYGKQGIRAFLTVRKLVKTEGFDVIQSQHEKSDVFNALLPRGARNALRISTRRDTGFLKSPRLRQLSRLLNKRFDMIVAPSASILDAVERDEGAPRSRMHCIANAVDTTRFQPLAASERQAALRAIDCTDSNLMIGCVADLVLVKRHEDLVDAFADLRVELPNACLILIGDGPRRGILERRIRELGLTNSVRLLGRRPDIDKLLPAFDLFVLASDTEGLSNAILEAQACGLPVVTTHVGGNPDLVDADCGILVPPRDPRALAEAMGRLLRDRDRREQMGAVARMRVTRDHSIAAMTRAYTALYREHTHVC
jgi:glycosyltransferase involved in cell wall biosynthesis